MVECCGCGRDLWQSIVVSVVLSVVVVVECCDCGWELCVRLGVVVVIECCG